MVLKLSGESRSSNSIIGELSVILDGLNVDMSKFPSPNAREQTPLSMTDYLTLLYFYEGLCLITQFRVDVMSSRYLEMSKQKQGNGYPELIIVLIWLWLSTVG